MDTLSLLLSFIFGTIVGSFLNVVSLRFNTGTTLGGRSKCMTCGKQLTWKELIPIVSFAAQKGACKKCKSKISWQYPLVEFLAGAIFVLIFLKFPPTDLIATISTVIYLLIACMLVVITVYDIKHKIIPDSFVFAFGFLAVLSLFVGGTSYWHLPDFWALIAGPLLAAPFAFIWLISRGQWMGLGDAKLVLGIGWLLGIGAGANAIILSFWIAAIISVAWLFITYKKFKTKTEIPFGPYLILGMYIVFLFDAQVIDFALVRDLVFSMVSFYN